MHYEFEREGEEVEVPLEGSALSVHDNIRYD